MTPRLGIHLLLALAAASVALTGCATTSRFEWGNYEGSLYAYSKSPEQKEAYRSALVKAIEKGTATNRVAPGLNAELGYLSLADGDTKRAISLFEEEMRLFPESQDFMRKSIERIRAGESPSPNEAIAR